MSFLLRPPEWSKELTISFAKMDQEEFNAFYKACFNVCWYMILCNQFSSEEEAQVAIEHLLSLGN